MIEPIILFLAMFFASDGALLGHFPTLQSCEDAISQAATAGVRTSPCHEITFSPITRL